MTKLRHSEWFDQQSIAEEIIPYIGQLYRTHHVICSLYGRSMLNLSALDILALHNQHAVSVSRKQFDILETKKICEILFHIRPSSINIDVGYLLDACHRTQLSVSEFMASQKCHLEESKNSNPVTKDVVIYGFGRIGRLLTRILIERSCYSRGLNLKAIVLRKRKQIHVEDIEKRAALLRNDSIHGTIKGTVDVDLEKKQIIANGVNIQIIYADAPDDINYAEYGIQNAILVDSTGVWRDEASLSKHLYNNDIKKVLLTAPGKGNIKNIVFGINNHQINEQDQIISAASCTTNAVTPIFKIMHDHFGIEHAHLETVHAYTNDQNIIDNYHASDERRGRAASLNMVITKTGAAKAVTKVLPELANKLTGNAIRVPVPNVSIAILKMALHQTITTDQVNQYLIDCALRSRYNQQIGVSTLKNAVSTDFIGSEYPAVVDTVATIAQNNTCTLYVWYDNEFGYCCQLYRTLEQMAGIKFTEYPSIHQKDNHSILTQEKSECV